MKIFSQFFCTGLLVLSCTAMAAAPTAPSSLQVTGAWVRLLPGSLPDGGYFTLHNSGDEAVVLTGASAAAWKKIMMHHSLESNGESTMVMVKQRSVPAHGNIKFAPGGYHLMLMHAKKALRAGGTADVTLHFKGGRKLTVPFKLCPAGATGP